MFVCTVRTISGRIGAEDTAGSVLCSAPEPIPALHRRPVGRAAAILAVLLSVDPTTAA